MKNLILRSGALLACALSLASCGGGDGNLYLGGTVYGMTKPGLTLSNNGGPPVTIQPNSAGGASSFQFSGLEADDRFNIQIVNLPAGSKCESTNNVGKMGGYSENQIVFECYNIPQNLGGRLSAPLDKPIILNNGKIQVTVPAGQTTFTFTSKNAAGKDVGTVGNGEPFGVTVLDAGGKTCTVQNGTGIMTGDYNDVLVTCQ